MDKGSLIFILISAILINNFIVIRFLGICPFLGVSRKVETAIGMGMAVIFVMTLAGIISWMLYNYILIPLKVEFLETVAFILVIASLVQLVEMFLNKFSPTLYRALGIYLPLITTNCAVLGVALLNIDESYNFIQMTIHSFGAAIGWTLIIVLFAGVRERLEFSDIPEPFRGMAIAFIIAGLFSMAFLGFSGFLS